MSIARTVSACTAISSAVEEESEQGWIIDCVCEFLSLPKSAFALQSLAWMSGQTLMPGRRWGPGIWC